jgi:hypothetical protein
MDCLPEEEETWEIKIGKRNFYKIKFI